MRLLLGLILASGVIWVLLHRELLDPEVLRLWLREAGVWAPLVFVCLYAVSVVSFIPATIPAIAGGAIFGPFLGTGINLAGATLGAGVAFLLSRHIVSDWVRKRLGKRLTYVLESAEAEGWRFVAFARLVPTFPFFIINYAFGITRIKFLHYIIATLLFISPGMFAITYLGYAGRAAWSGDEEGIQKMLLALAMLAAFLFIPRFYRRLKQRRSETL